MKRLIKKYSHILIIAIVFVFCSITFVNQQVTMGYQEKNMDEITQKHEELSTQLDELKDKMKYTQSKQYIEDVARGKLGWLKKGQILFKFKND